MDKITVEFSRILAQHFPGDQDKLRALCIKGNDQLWGYNHVDVLAELAGLPAEDPMIEYLRAPYILMSAQYFILDAAVDGHLDEQNDLLFLPHLSVMIYSLIFQTAIQRLGTDALQELSLKMSKWISENASAVIREGQRRKGTFELGEEDYQIIVGRSNSTLLFYDVFCLLANRQPDPQVLNLISDLVYYLQFGDDLGDWEGDFSKGNYTPLLQECFKRLPEDRRNNYQAVQEQLFLHGVYEEYLSNIIRKLKKIEAGFATVEPTRSSRMRNYIRGAQDKAYTLLTNVVAAKITYLKQNAVN